MKGKKNVRFAAALICVSLLLVAVGGCGRWSGVDGNLIGSGLEFGSEKTVITISNESQPPLPLTHFTEAVGRKFPDVELVQTGYTGEYQNQEHMARVKGGDLSDIVMVKAGRKMLVDLTPYLMDLSSQSFPGAFNSSSLEKDSDGRIFFIPGPLSFNGIIYNRTLFEEKGWDIPHNYKELIRLARRIDASGIRAHQYPLSGAAMPLYAYSVCVTLNVMTDAEGQKWYARLSRGEEVSLEPMEKGFDAFEELTDAGFFRPEDREIDGAARDKNMLSRKLAMTAGEAGNIQYYNDNSSDEFAFLPHFQREKEGSWLFNLGFYFGANVELEKPENEKKQKAVMDILEFISTQEGQQALIEDGYGLIGSVRGVQIPDDPVLRDIHELISGGRYIMRPVFYDFRSVLEEGTAAFLEKKATAGELVERCRDIMENGPPEQPALGEAKERFSVLETGIYKAEAIREAMETDVAVAGMEEVNMVIPLRSTRSGFYAGPVTEDDVLRVANRKNSDPNYCSRASLTGADLLALLECGALIDRETEELQEASVYEHFHPYAVGGLLLTYDLSAPEGKRVLNARLADGSRLRPEARYLVSWITGTVPESVVAGWKDREDTKLSVFDALERKIRADGSLLPDRDKITFR